MPLPTRVFVRTAGFYLLVGALLGSVLLWGKGVGAARVWLLLPAHVSLLMWGWLWHLTFAIAYWILPRFSTPLEGTGTPSAARPRSGLVWVAYGALNAAIVLAALSPWLANPWVSPLSGWLQALAAVSFAVHSWPRVKPAMTRQ